MKKVSVTINFSVSELRKLLVDSVDLKITDKAKFEKLVTSKRFASALAYDIKTVWLQEAQDNPCLDLAENVGLESCTEDRTQFS